MHAQRWTGRDFVAVFPIASYAILASVIGIVYSDLGRWPVAASADPHGAGFELTGPGAFILMFAPLIAAPLGVIGTVALGLATISDVVDATRKRWFRIAMRGAVQTALSVLGVIWLVPLFGRVLKWAMD